MNKFRRCFRIALFVGFVLLAFLGLAKEKIELTWWGFQEPNLRLFQEAAQLFNQTRDDVEIVFKGTVYPYEEMHDKLMMAALSGVGSPDLCNVEIGKLGFFLRGSTIPFYDVSDVVEPYENELLKLRTDLYTFEGKLYGIPTHVAAGFIFYNTALFEELGLDPDDIVTWDDFIEMGKKITRDKDGDGKIDVWMTDVEINDLHMLIGLSKQRGGGIYDKDGNLLIDSQANIDALQFYQDLVYKYEIATVCPGGFHHDPSFFAWCNSGKVASVIMPQWFVTRFTDMMPDLAGKMIIRPLPAVTEGGKRSYMSGGTCTTITKQIDPKKIPIVKEFLVFAKVTYEANVRIAEIGFDPWRRDVYDDPRVMAPNAYFRNEPILETVKVLLDSDGIPSDYIGPLYPEVLELYRESIPFRAIVNREDPEKILKEAGRQIRSN